MTCLGDGALQRASSQAGSALEHRKPQGTPRSPERKLPAGEDAVMEALGKGGHLSCFMTTHPRALSVPGPLGGGPAARLDTCSDLL